MRQKLFTVACGATLVLGLAATQGCESMGGSGGGGKVTNQNQQETVRPDGTAVQTRTRTRETPSGTTVQETETRERKVTNPGAAGGAADPTKTDPGAGK